MLARHLDKLPGRMVHVLARTDADPAALPSAVRQAVLSADPTAAVSPSAGARLRSRSE